MSIFSRNRVVFGLLAGLFIGIGIANADVRLPAIISDNMVLQRGDKVLLWGWADPQEQVTVTLHGHSASATADASGKWRLTIDTRPMPSTPVNLRVTGKNGLTIHNVLVGQVWLCSGQSNMEFNMLRLGKTEKDFAAADYPEIRHFFVKHKTSFTAADEVEGGWEICTPDTVRGFSATAYYFGRELYKQLQTPVGLINSSVGGTPIESWISQKALEPLHDFDRALAEQSRPVSADQLAKYQAALAQWESKLPADPGNEGESKGWAKSDFDDSSWKTMAVPSAFEYAGYAIDGVVWYRREIQLPADFNTTACALGLGAISNVDTTYVNGIQIGQTHISDPPWGAIERVYPVPAGLLKPGKNIIAVRVFNRIHQGGLVGPGCSIRLTDGHIAIAMTGRWRFNVEQSWPQMDARYIEKAPRKPGINSGMPTVLYNAMIDPLHPYTIAGVVWYQGESNTWRATQYRKLLPTLINDWRQRWNQSCIGDIAAEAGPDFPFYIVQLPNFQAYKPDPADSTWAELREAQALAAQTSKNTSIVVTIDLGEEKNIHPRTKEELGRRLALQVAAKTYGRRVECDGPLYSGMSVEGDHIRVHFAHAAGLVARPMSVTDKSATTQAMLLSTIPTDLKGFAICGDDRKFVWAHAQIIGDSVVVSNPAVSHPLAVRYAWADNPVANLYNEAGLPAAPFRTDDFPLSTEGKK